MGSGKSADKILNSSIGFGRFPFPLAPAEWLVPLGGLIEKCPWRRRRAKRIRSPLMIAHKDLPNNFGLTQRRRGRPRQFYEFVLFGGLILLSDDHCSTIAIAAIIVLSFTTATKKKRRTSLLWVTKLIHFVNQAHQARPGQKEEAPVTCPAN